FQGMLVIFSQMIGYTGEAGMHITTTKVFTGNNFTGCSFDPWRATEENGSLIGYNSGSTRHGRHSGTTRRTTAHYHGNLGNALARHTRLIIENTSEVITIREDFIL